MNQDEQKLFNNPPASFRIVPFWFWNGAMEESEIAYQLREMRDKGLGGVFICARQGLEIPYLSDLWFDRVKFAAETAREYGLEVWLYDEYPYPSGMSGGEVILQHPDAKQYNLLHESFEVSGPQKILQKLPWARILLAKAVPRDSQTGQLDWENVLDLQDQIGNLQEQTVFQKTGLTSYNQKRYFSYGPAKRLVWKAPPGDWQIIIFLEKEIEDFKFFGTFFDPCHAEAVQTFLRTTHERYARLLNQTSLETIKGIFSDETGLYGTPPWSPRLLSFFEQHNGYSLQENLMALHYSTGRNVAKIRYDYFQTLHLLLRNSYHRQVAEWCEDHQLQYVAEVPAVRMTTQLYSNIPGGDSAHEKLGRSLDWILDHYALNLRSNPKMVASLARQLGRERALIECFHSVGWSMTLQDAKWMIDRMGAMGINFFNFHAFFYTLDGLRKHDAPPSQFLQTPYWPHFRKLADYAARISYIMSQGKPTTSIAIVDPTTSLWTHLGNPFHEFQYFGSDPAEEQRLNRIKTDWAFICKTLLLNQLDYDHLDPELLAQGEIRRGQLQIGKAAYSTIILPPLSNLEASAWNKLKEFLAQGGTVISLGLLPYEVIDEQTNIEQEALNWFGLANSALSRGSYWQVPGATLGEEVAATEQVFWLKGKYSGYFLPCQGGVTQARPQQLIALIKEKLSRPITIEATEADRRSLLIQEREWPDGARLIFLSNQEDREITVELRVAAGFRLAKVEELDLESGGSNPVDAEFGGQNWKIPLQLAPFQARLLQLDQEKTTQSAFTSISNQAQKPGQLKVNTTEQPWIVSALQPNAARFGTFHFALDLENAGLKKGWQTGKAGLDWPEVEAKTLIDQCDDLAGSQKLALPLKFRQTFGTPIRVSLNYPLVCWYQTSFEVSKLPAEARLRMDASALQGDYSIYLNGNELTPSDFQGLREYDTCNRSCTVEPLLRPGQNTLVVRVEACYDWDGLTDPLYLVGNFGVYSGSNGELVVGKAVETGELSGKFIAGYPYYAGTLSFQRTINLDNLPAEPEFEFGFENWPADLHDCVEVVLNDYSLGVKAWSPYTWRGNQSWLKLGENKLEVRITNTLVRLLEGRYFDYKTHRLLTIEGFEL
jgi:hypothetical protein